MMQGDDVIADGGDTLRQRQRRGVVDQLFSATCRYACASVIVIIDLFIENKIYSIVKVQSFDRLQEKHKAHYTAEQGLAFHQTHYRSDPANSVRALKEACS